MKARDIMTPKPFVVIPTDDVCKAAELMRYENIGGVPVVSDPARPALVGLITDRDITIRCVARGRHDTCFVRDIMTPMPLKNSTPRSRCFRHCQTHGARGRAAHSGGK